jgi:hypothetical protein
MLQLVEKILLEACESKNGNAAIDAFKRLRSKRDSHSDITMDESTNTFSKVCCYAIHELYYQIGIETTTGVKVDKHEEMLIKLLIDLLFVIEKPSTLMKYLSISINDVSERVSRYRKICKNAASEGRYHYFEPLWISELVYNRYIGATDSSPIIPSGSDGGFIQGQLHSENGAYSSNNIVGGRQLHSENGAYSNSIDGVGRQPQTTTSITSKYIGGKQLVTIKTVVEQEISMYIDVNIQCPKCVKIYMPHLEEPIYISRVIKKYVKFAKIFDGKGKENTLSYYYKFNKNESTLEFIDEDMESEVAELLGVGILEKEIIDEDVAMEEAAMKNKLTDEQVAAFKEQLSEVRWSIKNAV